MRDYGIDLGGNTLHEMSWRRFQVLLNHLSPYGALASIYDEAQKEAEKEPDPASDKEAANNFFQSVTAYRR